MNKLQEIKNKVYCLKWGTDSIEEAMEKELVPGGRFIWIDENYEEKTYKIINVYGFDDLASGNNSYEIQAIDESEICKVIYSFDGYYEDYEMSFTEMVEKILGTNISLADILMAIRKLTIRDNNIDEWLTVYDTKVLSLLSLYELENDSLDWHAEHKPELINFLHSIICK